MCKVQLCTTCRNPVSTLPSSFARPTGFEPAIYSVTGNRVNRATPRPHCVNFKKFTLVPVNGIGPLFEAYESSVLPLNYTGNMTMKIARWKIRHKQIYVPRRLESYFSENF